VLLVNVVYFLPVAQAHWVSQVMFGAWALVEVVRYSYYALQLVGAPIPYAVHLAALLDLSSSTTRSASVASSARSTSRSTRSPPCIRRSTLRNVRHHALVSCAGLPVMYGFMLKQRRKYLSGD
jgi:hypothetical protein